MTDESRKKIAEWQLSMRGKSAGEIAVDALFGSLPEMLLREKWEKAKQQKEQQAESFIKEGQYDREGKGGID